ncbi:Na+/H+-dicarboxylate symporter [Olsenella sp. KH3B4]|uniref:dicarboxylate/amino acid:cation symporter n=1 Tax=Olsenella sp. KH3B4 TaxID=1855394 RepID=UPI0008B2B545|nr:dicarboxylate/amino acid:cation symporter [Olsenella sp. KH3B4]SET24643.1 Na+/H+-dicarboxylate symporter [Olsenella sp. KH3B4]
MAAEKSKRVSPTLLIVISMVAGFIVGLLVGNPMNNVKFIGDIFFHLVQMGIVPFVMCTIIEAIGGLTAKDLSDIGIKGIIWFAASSILASAFGIACTLLFQPGAGLADSALVQNAMTTAEASSGTWQDTVSGFFGSNIVASMGNGSMVQCIVFAIALGLVCSGWRQAHDNKCVVYDFTVQLGALILNIIRVVMKVAPVGIFCYVSAMVGSMGAEVVMPLLRYLLVLGGAVLVFMILWIALVYVRCRLSPARLIRKMWRMSVMALSTTSSAVTLPVEMQDAKERLGLREDIADLVLPLGMPLNSNGASIHLAVTSLTIAQIYGVTYAGADLIALTVICTLLSLANAVAPGADLVSLTMIVPQLGLPLDSIGIFAGLTYPVGAIRTILNVNSDVYCALMVAADYSDGINRSVFDADN